MKLKTTLILSAFGVLASAAGALAIPVSRTPVATVDPATTTLGNPSEVKEGSRITTGDTLLVDARLGHSTIAKSARGETFLFAQVTAGDDKPGTAAPPMNLGIVIDRSGSMKGERIANAMNAAVAALERMRDGDSVSIVAFDQSAQVIV